MYAVILAGGSGTRLWPLSRELFPKQYLALLEDERSLFQATVDRVLPAAPEERVIVVTHRDQAGEIRRQLGLSNRTAVRLLAEPQARNTAPAIGLAAFMIMAEAGPDAVMAVLPSDHLIPEAERFAALLRDGAEAARAHGLVTFGIEPAYPETGYGYICRGEQLDDKAFRVEKFVEKPSLERAESYLKEGRYFWNSGMFVFRVGALLEQFRLHLPQMHAALEKVDFGRLEDLPALYSSLEKISIDYGILERASGVTVIPTGIAWSDLGSWEAYYRISPKDDSGNSHRGRVISVDSSNNLVFGSSRLVGTVGVDDLVVVDTPDALLVCRRDRSQEVKAVVDHLKADQAPEALEHRTVYRPWGSYTSLELAESYQVKRINVNPGARLSLQSHRRRSENWVVVEGEALVTVDDRQVTVRKGESIFIPTGARHRMENRTAGPLAIIEVQNGDYLGEDDIIRYEDDYGRTPEPSKPGGEGGSPEASPAGGKPEASPRPGEAAGSPGTVSGPVLSPGTSPDAAPPPSPGPSRSAEGVSNSPADPGPASAPGGSAPAAGSNPETSALSVRGITAPVKISNGGPAPAKTAPNEAGEALPGDGRGEAGQKLSAARVFERWLAHPGLDRETLAELEAMRGDPARIESHFGAELAFGTGGMRGLIGPGLNRINIYTIRRATQGLADYINGLPANSATPVPGSGRTSHGSPAGDPAGTAGSSSAGPANEPADGPAAGPPAVVIAYDTRRCSEIFAGAAARVLAANGIRALLFNGIRPTPMLSYATRELACAAGVVITASHNPAGYNGYKVYGPDGGQAVSPLVDDLIAAIGRIDIFDGVRSFTVEEGETCGLIETVDPALDRAYLEQVSALSLSEPGSCLKVVYTPLHGTGSVYIPTLLGAMSCVDLIQVPEQAVPDPAFSTVRVPNPEDPAALDMALKLAAAEEADLVLATDPDGDRVGTAVRDRSGGYTILSGNQVGALLLEYVCSRLAAKGALPPDPVMVKTIVTGELGSRVAAVHGLKTVNTLTGFKFIGEKIEQFEREGGASFVFGYEESCGYLTGTFVRDKDAVISSFLITEMAAYYKDRGLGLLDVLSELQQRHGYFREDLLTVELENISGADRYVAAYHGLPPRFAGLAVVEKRDYETGKGLDLLRGRELALDLPRSPVLQYTLADGSWFAVRPSGTEPKVKFYLSTCAPDPAEAERRLSALREAVLAVTVEK